MKENKFFKKEKPNKKLTEWYKNQYGLSLKEIYLPTDDYFRTLEKLFNNKWSKFASAVKSLLPLILSKTNVMSVKHYMDII